MAELDGQTVPLHEVFLEPGYYWFRPEGSEVWEVVHVGEGPTQWVSRFKGGHGQLQRGDTAGAFTGPIFVQDVGKLLALEACTGMCEDNACPVHGIEAQRIIDGITPPNVS